MAEVIQLVDLTPKLRASICNGCGPGKWKRHTWRWKLAQFLTTGLYEACEAHDLAYWLRGTLQDREQADLDFRNAIGEIAQRSNFIARWLIEQEQPILFTIVEGYGGEYFHVGTRATKADLNKYAHKLGDDPLPYPDLGAAA